MFSYVFFFKKRVFRALSGRPVSRKVAVKAFNQDVLRKLSKIVEGRLLPLEKMRKIRKLAGLRHTNFYVTPDVQYRLFDALLRIGPFDNAIAKYAKINVMCVFLMCLMPKSAV